jgi:hypothetical protein
MNHPISWRLIKRLLYESSNQVASKKEVLLHESTNQVASNKEVAYEFTDSSDQW